MQAPVLKQTSTVAVRVSRVQYTVTEQCCCSTESQHIWICKHESLTLNLQAPVLKQSSAVAVGVTSNTWIYKHESLTLNLQAPVLKQTSAMGHGSAKFHLFCSAEFHFFCSAEFPEGADWAKKKGLFKMWIEHVRPKVLCLSLAPRGRRALNFYLHLSLNTAN